MTLIFCPKQKEICEEKIKSLTKVSFSLNRQTCEDRLVKP